MVEWAMAAAKTGPSRNPFISGRRAAWIPGVPPIAARRTDMGEIREADVPQDPVDHDLATIAKFQPPDGRLLQAAGYPRIRLDSADFMTGAHGLYRSGGFVDIDPYPGSEIPDRYKPYWVFMERTLT
jgi:hypothetical protein